MSATVHYKGKIRQIKRNGASLEEAFKSFLTEREKDLFREFLVDDEIEERIFMFSDENFENRKVIIVDGELFINEICERVEEYDIFNIYTENGFDYEYDLMYYDGGTSFGEAIGIALKKSGIEFKEK